MANFLKKTKKEEVKEVKENKTRTVDNDNRRVYFMSGKKNDKTVPKILLEGKWLVECGFLVGKTYKAEVIKLEDGRGKLILTVNK